MRFPTAVDSQNLFAILSDFIAITGWDAWERRRAELKCQLSGNVLLSDFFEQRHSLELGLFKLVDERRRGVKPPRQIRHVVEYQIASFMNTTVEFYKRLESDARKRLAGRLMDGLKSDTALNALCHEMATAAHFLQLGFDVDPTDLRIGGGFDFLISNGDIEVEVECKLATTDIGQQIHRRHMLELCGAVRAKLRPLRPNLTGGYFVNIVVPERLSGNHALHNRIAEAVQLALRDKQFTTAADLHVYLRNFDLAISPFHSPDRKGIAPDELRLFVSTALGKVNPNAMAHCDPGRLAIVLVIESDTPDDVGKGIYRPLREATKKQFSRKRPGVLVVRLPGLSDKDLLSLASNQKQEPNTLQAIATRLFRNEDRRFLHTVAYLAAGSVSRKTHVNGNIQQTVISESGPCYVFRNDTAMTAELLAYNFFPVQ